MAAGFYCTVVRGQKVGYLLGPYPDKSTARAMIPEARRLAHEIDRFTAFDAFGVVRVECEGHALPPGVLNVKLEESKQ